MHISQVRIRNFRGLEEIEFHPRRGINVLVGPNAVGKTSVLEAIRLAKALLVPRYRDERGQVLMSLGASSPHHLLGNNQIDFAALAGNEARPLEVSLDIALSNHETDRLKRSNPGLAEGIVRSRIGQERQSQLDLIQFMSSSKGREQLRAASIEAQNYVKELESSQTLRLGLAMRPYEGGLEVTSNDTLAQIIFQGLEQLCPPQLALMSYFPADRALPFGEVNIQLGSADLQQQVHSHLGTPATKYNRLKQIIVTAYVLGGEIKQQLENSFNAMFGLLLPGKKLEAIRQKATGVLSVLIRDDRTGKVFDIDSMSSGEKGLILSFLLLRNGAAPRGIALLDEPELHLNPAVCARLIPFLYGQVVEPLDLQVFLCTHSAEILSTALSRDDGSIFHLRTPRDITPVQRSDKVEVFEILKRLGLNSMDVVSWHGTIFVEGDEDADLLSAGFPELLAGYQMKSLGGRSEVEKDIVRLQEAERRGEVTRLHVFLFDKDKQPTSLVSTVFVRVQQWDRYCIESYLTDEHVLFDVMQRFCVVKPESKGALKAQLKELALAQASDEAVRRTYGPLEPENCGLRPKEVLGKSPEEAGAILVDRMRRMRASLAELDDKKWVAEFVANCGRLAAQLRTEWDDTWKKECDAKRLFRDLSAKFNVKVAPAYFKTEIVREMRVRQSDDWKVLKTLLSQVIANEAR